MKREAGTACERYGHHVQRREAWPARSSLFWAFNTPVVTYMRFIESTPLQNIRLEVTITFGRHMRFTDTAASVQIKSLTFSLLLFHEQQKRNAHKFIENRIVQVVETYDMSFNYQAKKLKLQHLPDTFYYQLKIKIPQIMNK